MATSARLASSLSQSRPRVDSRFYLAPVGGAAWLVGIWAGSRTDTPVLFWLLMAAAAVVGAAALWRTGRLGLALAACAALAFGAARYTAARPQIDAGHVAAHNGETVELVGMVAAEPELTDTRRQLRVAAEELQLDGQTRPVSGLVLVETARLPAIDYGATVRLAGELLAPAADNSPGFAAMLERQGIHSTMPFPEVTVVAEGGGRRLTRALIAVRERGRAVLRTSLPEPHASLLTGILLGDDSGLPYALAQDFRATGMTHIIAISGFNIALIIVLLDRLSAPLLPRRTAAVVIMLFIALYTLLVGASASVVRAAIMGITYLIGLRLIGRPTLAVAGLFTAAFVMTLRNPLTVWDIGFQLSFAATLGLLLYAGSWTRRLRQGAAVLPDRARALALPLLTEGLVVTLAAQVLTLPLILFHFGRLSLASLPANLLVLPAQPAVMMTGGLVLLLGAAWPVAGRVAGLPAWLFLSYTIAIIERLARLPAASVPLQLSPFGLVALYIAIAALTLLAALDPQKRRELRERSRPRARTAWVLAAMALVAILGVAWLMDRPDSRLHVAFLDVGQGDAIFIQSPAGRQVLIDGGRYPSVVLDELGEQMPFWDRSLDAVIVTHPDDDHVAGLTGVVERYEVDRLITNGAPADSNPAFAAMLGEVEPGRVHVAQVAEAIDLGGGARLDILHAGGGDGRNDASVVARLTYGELSVLLTGDAEAAAETALLASGRPLSAVVLKAGHHGANTSSGEPFLRAVAPQYIVISAGAGNSYGHPAPEMLARAAAVGAAVLRTDEMGTIELVSDGERIWWETEGDENWSR